MENALDRKKLSSEKEWSGVQRPFFDKRDRMDIAFILKKISLKIAEYQPAFVYTEENKGYNKEQ